MKTRGEALLSELAIKNAKPGIHPQRGDTGGRPYKLSDGGGLYIEVFPTGGKIWRYDYRFAEKRLTISYGRWPDVPIASIKSKTGVKGARDLHREAKEALAAGRDPGLLKRQAKLETALGNANTFQALAEEWIAKNKPTWAPAHTEKIESRFRRDILPWLGSQLVREIKAADALSVVRRIEARGAKDTARRALMDIGAVLRYATATGRADRDVTTDLRGALQFVPKKHFVTLLDPKAIGALLRAMRGYSGSYAVRAALHLAPLLFVRPGELRQLKWAEVDLEASEIRLIPSKIKRGHAKVEHIVPLATQAVAVLRELQPLTGREHFVFPGEANRNRPMSENTVNAALRRLGYDTKNTITGHGFRSMARTLLREQGWPADAIERQLAHKPAGPLGAAYDRAQFLVERKKMMQAWADYLDTLFFNHQPKE